MVNVGLDSESNYIISSLFDLLYFSK